MRIYLTNAPWETYDHDPEGKKPPYRHYGCKAGSRWPWRDGPPVYVPYPFFLGYATTYLRKAGVDATFYDAIALLHTTQQYLQTMRDVRPDIVIIETSTPSFNSDIEIAREVSQFAEVCLTGPHATVFAADIIRDYPFVKYVLKGEYERNALEMCRTRRAGVYEFNHLTDAEFDALPFPYRDPSYFPRYKDVILGPREPQLPIMEARGCPFSCKFCMWPPTMWGRKIRVFSNSRILSEIEDAMRHYHPKDIFFDSDTFGVCKPEKIIELAREIKKFGVPWSVMSRADLHPLEVWRELQANGCYGYRFGIETFSPRLSKMIAKRENFDEALTVIRGLKATGARVHLCTMSGYPTETDEDKRIHEARMDEIRKLGCTYQVSWMVPFPGTPYHEDLLSKGMNFIKDWDCYSGEHYNSKANDMVQRIVREYPKEATNENAAG